MDAFEKYEKYVITNCAPPLVPIEIEHAKGATYFCKDGRQFIDGYAGVAVSNCGHGQEKIINAAKKQLDRFIHCGSYLYPVDVVADLAEKLAEITPGNLQKCFFGNSGAEAIEGAMRLAKKYTKKNEILALTNSFHGRTYGTLSITGNSKRKIGGGPYMPGVSFCRSPYYFRSNTKHTDPESYADFCADSLEEAIKLHTSQNIAFFIAEPVLGEGGIIVPPPNYYKRIKEILDHYKILFIVDEVQSGFGRTGKMFAIEHYGVVPDIMVMAKGIANGLPLSCFITREEIAKSFSPGDLFSTFGGNPVSCATSLATINFFEENNLVQESARKGKYFMETLREATKNNSLVGEIRGLGLMIGIELVKDIKKTPASEEALKIKKALYEMGVLIGIGGYDGNVLRFQPPLVITDNELNKVIECLVRALKSIN